MKFGRRLTFMFFIVTSNTECQISVIGCFGNKLKNDETIWISDIIFILTIFVFRWHGPSKFKSHVLVQNLAVECSLRTQKMALQPISLEAFKLKNQNHRFFKSMNELPEDQSLTCLKMEVHQVQRVLKRVPMIA